MEVSFFVRSAERFDPIGRWEALPDKTVIDARVFAAIHAWPHKDSGEKDILFDFNQISLCQGGVSTFRWLCWIFRQMTATARLAQLERRSQHIQ